MVLYLALQAQLPKGRAWLILVMRVTTPTLETPFCLPPMIRGSLSLLALLAGQGLDLTN